MAARDTDGSDTNAAAAKPSEAALGLSQFLGKVLDQLSLTSWLPAVVLVSAYTLLIRFHSQQNLSVGDALTSLTAVRPVGLLVVMLFAVVVAATLTQAFAFEFIRFFEGYWGANSLALFLVSIGVARHRHRLLRARRKRSERTRDAFEKTCASLAIRPGYGPDFVTALRWFDSGRKTPRPALPRALIREVRRAGWHSYAPAALLDSEDRWRARTESYPSEHRLLPTKLGNVLRSREDGLGQDGRDLEGLVMRRYASIPIRLMARHDQFRDRLEMYCVLVATFICIAVGTVPLLAPCVTSRRWYVHWSASVGGCVTALFLAWMCYQAAVASARGYGSVLAEIAELPTDDELGRGPAKRLIDGISRVFARRS